MNSITTELRFAQAHKTALNTKATTVSQVVVPRATSQGSPPAKITAANLGHEVNGVTAGYTPVLTRSAGQIVTLHGRRAEDDAESSRQIGIQ